jgi:hypothetical protein
MTRVARDIDVPKLEPAVAAELVAGVHEQSTARWVCAARRACTARRGKSTARGRARAPPPPASWPATRPASWLLELLRRFMALDAQGQAAWWLKKKY